MKGFKLGQLGAELRYVSTKRVATMPNLREGRRLLRAPSPSESEQYERNHLIPEKSIRRREIAIDNIFDEEQDPSHELGLEDSRISFHPDSAEESDLHFPYCNPEEQVEHDYEGLTPQDPEYWDIDN